MLRRMEEALRVLPGVTDVAFASQLPLTGTGPLSPYAYDEQTARNWESETSDGRNVSPAYFRAMGTRLLSGRPFDNHDVPEGARIIIDETLAARAWPGESAIGKRLQVKPTGTPEPYAEVIGVVEHVRAHDLARAVRPQIYGPFGTGGRAYVVIRATVAPASLAPQVRAVMARLDADLPVDRLRPMSAYVADGLGQTRLNLLMMSFFGFAALLLSSVGIYGVFSYAVGQRTREIGIRMALGGEPRHIRNTVLLEGLRIVAISTMVGLLFALALSRGVATLLYGVRALDPATFMSMTALLIVVALTGCYIPARRATAINPAVALKVD
jgi:putative ABC transport system permease protein